MKKPFSIRKRLAILTTVAFLIINSAAAQKNGILPLTGMKFYGEGISAKLISVRVDGAQLMANRIPLNKEIEIRFQQPLGFTADNNKKMYAGAEVTVLSPKGDVLFMDQNACLKTYANGFNEKDLNSFNIRFIVAAELMKNNFAGTLKIRLYDLKGKNQLRLESPVSFAKTGEAYPVSKTVKEIKCNNGANGVINGLQAKSMLVNVDTTIKVSPKMAYTSVDISNIEGSSLSEIFQGKENFWVYDSDMNEVKITDILLKKVNGAMENNTVNYTLKIPYRLKSNTSKLYTVRYRWESPDKKQLIDVVVTN